MSDWDAEKSEQFGADLPAVQPVLRELEKVGVFMVDATPNNIRIVV